MVILQDGQGQHSTVSAYSRIIAVAALHQPPVVVFAAGNKRSDIKKGLIHDLPAVINDDLPAKKGDKRSIRTVSGMGDGNRPVQAGDYGF